MSSIPAPKLTMTQWLVCTIAAIGFAFDIYELLMLPLILKPAMASLSAPLVDELVKGGMERAEALAFGCPGVQITVPGHERYFLARRLSEVSSVYSGAG